MSLHKQQRALQKARSGALALPVFVRYADLVAAGVIQNWTTLARLIERAGFPEGVMIGPNMRAWRLDDVETWLASRPSARKVMPEGCVLKRGRPRRVTEATA